MNCKEAIKFYEEFCDNPEHLLDIYPEYKDYVVIEKKSLKITLNELVKIRELMYEEYGDAILNNPFCWLLDYYYNLWLFEIAFKSENKASEVPP